ERALHGALPLAPAWREGVYPTAEFPNTQLLPRSYYPRLMNCPVSARDEAAPRYDASLIRALFGYLATAVAISLLAHPLAGSLGVHESGAALCFWGLVLLAPVAALLAARTTRRPTETTIAQDDPGIETLKRLEAEESRYRSLVRNLPVGIFHYD